MPEKLDPHKKFELWLRAFEVVVMGSLGMLATCAYQSTQIRAADKRAASDKLIARSQVMTNLIPWLSHKDSAVRQMAIVALRSGVGDTLSASVLQFVIVSDKSSSVRRTAMSRSAGIRSADVAATLSNVANDSSRSLDERDDAKKAERSVRLGLGYSDNISILLAASPGRVLTNMPQPPAPGAERFSALLGTALREATRVVGGDSINVRFAVNLLTASDPLRDDNTLLTTAVSDSSKFIRTRGLVIALVTPRPVEALGSSEDAERRARNLSQVFDSIVPYSRRTNIALGNSSKASILATLRDAVSASSSERDLIVYIDAKGSWRENARTSLLSPSGEITGDELRAILNTARGRVLLIVNLIVPMSAPPI